MQRRDAVPTPAPTPAAPTSAAPTPTPPPVTPPHQPPEAPAPPPASRTARASSPARDSGKGKRTTTAATQIAAFDARTLTDGQFDELVHRLIGPLTRLLRTEFRLDRERIGKLRDPRR
ncbi:hypothetical protein [Streptomyces sp. Rer75]|uniref:hypothetical protein n=1 Tax=unclassified Streptomyces TaxID=2593676 RepID=UPI0015D03DBF|nr:hypothetical protein [Streptomyces sp. Rer75]QLH23634.1 hypothetical protein HYQ63_25905 [Streptomyces sp. Rer75]